MQDIDHLTTEENADLHLHHTISHIEDDGRVRISFTDRAQSLLQGHGKKTKPDQHKHHEKSRFKPHRRQVQRVNCEPLLDGFAAAPKMNIAILITGSRGDVQPFIALGQVLKAAPYHHRVRICTHPVFKDFVEENGLEFFSIGGDPAKLMAYMVKNPGILPTLESVQAGEIGKRKTELAEMLEGAWKGCTQAGNGMDYTDLASLTLEGDVLMTAPPPFVADAIIANPPTYAHIHIAEKLGIPLHMMFTMPWTPTGSFPHPLAHMDATKVDAKIANAVSYRRMEFLTWAGLSDIVNRFREKTLMLDPISPAWGHRLFDRLEVPFTYCWSEALIPKPEDWGSHISISGFFFLPLASSYTPDPELQAFLDAEPPPVYIGFGSIVVDDPVALTQMIFDAVKKAGVRALVSKGWGNVGGDHPPEDIFLLGNVPHDWLFPRVSAVVHHGGAGTTAIGIALGKPTIIVPFFGDQPFWADMIYRAGAGPEAVPFKQLTADRLADNIKRALEPDIKAKAHAMSERIKGENGMKKAAELFHHTPQMEDVGCFLLPERVAVWHLRRTNVQLSTLAAAVLVTHDVLKPEQLKLVRHKRWYVEEGAHDPVFGVLGAFATTATGYVNDVSDYKKDLSKRPASPSLKATTQSDPRVSASSYSSGGAVPDDPTVGSSDAPNRKSTEEENHFPEQDTSKAESSKGGKAKGEAEHHHRHKRQGSSFATATKDFAGSVAGHSLKLPVAVLYNLANGFHNAPKTFHDDTVRVRDNITGLSSGLAVAGKEVGFGLYDGITGLVTQPYRGYQKGNGDVGASMLGLTKGVGKGVVGLVSKTSAAVLGVPGYSLKGLEREIERWQSGTDGFLRTEVEAIKSAKDEVLKTGKNSGDHSEHAEKLMWEEAKGSGLGKRIIERRVWEGYREIHQLRGKEGNASVIEKKILERWNQLHIGGKFP